MKHINMKEILQDKNKTNDFIRDNTKLVYDVMYKHFSNLMDTYDADDYIQEGIIGLYDAMKRYDEKKNCEFSTLAYICIKTTIIKLITLRGRKYNSVNLNNISIYKTISKDDESLQIIDIIKDKINIEETYCDKDEILHKREEIIRKLNSNLSPKRKEILQHALQMKSQAQIARDLNCSREYIRISIKSILEEANKICA